ncbi:MAG: TIGR00725 family protein [Anaerolineales bacterium]
MTNRLKIVSIIGGADCTDEESALAEHVGVLLANKGVVVVTGGGWGVMEAASRGAASVGGISIGILPGDEHDSGNEYLKISIPTGLGHTRNAIVAQAGESVIAIGGSYGTLSEIGIALKVGRRVIGLGSWEARDASKQDLGILVAQNADEAVNLALQE